MNLLCAVTASVKCMTLLHWGEVILLQYVILSVDFYSDVIIILKVSVDNYFKWNRCQNSWSVGEARLKCDGRGKREDTLGWVSELKQTSLKHSELNNIKELTEWTELGSELFRSFFPCLYVIFVWFPVVLHCRRSHCIMTFIPAAITTTTVQRKVTSFIRK